MNTKIPLKMCIMRAHWEFEDLFLHSLCYFGFAVPLKWSICYRTLKSFDNTFFMYG